MEISEIKDLMASFDDAKSTVLEIKDKDFSIRFEKAPAVKVETITATENVSFKQEPEGKNISSVATKAELESSKEIVSAESKGTMVKAPLVGIFYAAASPEAEAYVQVGSKVKKGDVLCLIEAMKMMSEINAPCDGTITKICVKNQDVVGFEDPLFIIGD